MRKFLFVFSLILVGHQFSHAGALLSKRRGQQQYQAQQPVQLVADRAVDRPVDIPAVRTAFGPAANPSPPSAPPAPFTPVTPVAPAALIVASPRPSGRESTTISALTPSSASSAASSGLLSVTPVSAARMTLPIPVVALSTDSSPRRLSASSRGDFASDMPGSLPIPSRVIVVAANVNPRRTSPRRGAIIGGSGAAASASGAVASSSVPALLVVTASMVASTPRSRPRPPPIVPMALERLVDLDAEPHAPPPLSAHLRGYSDPANMARAPQ